MKILDFRSDTVTQPTDEMREAMKNAVVGDDILGEDPTVSELEKLTAKIFNKEAALFTVSGTMANQIAIMALCQPGDEVILGEDTHIYNLEVGGLAALSGVQSRPIKAIDGKFKVADIKKVIRPQGLQSSISRVLCLENTYNLNRGIPLPLEYFKEIAALAQRNGLTVYLDGARIFNAALAYNMTVAELCAPVDCLQFCLCKGLAAPFGAMLVGSSAFIERARWMKQRVGGGLRQGGHMAAAGIVALTTMVNRLTEDHINANKLAVGLAALNPGLVDLSIPRTNIVHIDFCTSAKNSTYVANKLLLEGIKIKKIDECSARMIVHYGIDSADIDRTLAVYKSIINN